MFVVFISYYRDVVTGCGEFKCRIIPRIEGIVYFAEDKPFVISKDALVPSFELV